MEAEAVGFPFAAQAARLLRQTRGRKDESVALLTSLEPKALGAARWLELNRQAWGIESGLHQRLDVSHNDDRCRVRNDNGMMVLGMMRRLSNSLFMEWRGHQRRPEHQTTTDFQSEMSAEHARRAVRMVLSKRPSLK